ncbi:glycosyltransferase family 2 protein [Moorena sp. SIO3H5]|uniref:glycosyltransferase family 2 protein n=1 Tax=Moorena sp. SIO3H5 TaxID=2607834 RepID=UPI0013BAA28F|nr:glycosyltransferase family 2 protein [Moorena sp. SIO3H5]NEO70954.1 glycosyltransferase family 2 protein [Moorena sp. SIO3H5]
MSKHQEGQKPLVSVIIPTYNRLSYLKQAVESVLQQTYKNLEIIVSDDCSPENPQAMIESFQDDRIQFRRNSNNLGNGPNVAGAFKQAQGKYVASLNDDDLWNPDFLEKLVPPLEANPNVVVAFCDHYIIDADGVINYATTEAHTRLWKRDQLKAEVYQPFFTIGLVDQAVSPASSAVIRRDKVNWDELLSVGVYWDYYLTYLACRNGDGAYYYPERLTRYRVHELSETHMSGSGNAKAQIRKGKSGIFCYEHFLADPQLQKHRNYFTQKLAQANTTLGIGLIRDGRVAEARPYLFRALNQSFSLRTVAALILTVIPQQLVNPFEISPRREIIQQTKVHSKLH